MLIYTIILRQMLIINYYILNYINKLRYNYKITKVTIILMY